MVLVAWSVSASSPHPTHCLPLCSIYTVFFNLPTVSFSPKIKHCFPMLSLLPSKSFMLGLCPGQCGVILADSHVQGPTHGARYFSGRPRPSLSHMSKGTRGKNMSWVISNMTFLPSSSPLIGLLIIRVALYFFASHVLKLYIPKCL